jgi:hypothetical protein
MRSHGAKRRHRQRTRELRGLGVDCEDQAFASEQLARRGFDVFLAAWLPGVSWKPHIMMRAAYLVSLEGPR